MKTNNGEQGTSAVEFALVLPVLLFVLFAIIEFSFILYDKAVITNASREGARAGVVYRVDGTGSPAAVSAPEIERIVNNYCASNLISFAAAASAPLTTVTGNCSSTGNSLAVTVSYPYTFLVLPNFTATLAKGLTLTAVTDMKCENQ